MAELLKALIASNPLDFEVAPLGTVTWQVAFWPRSASVLLQDAVTVTWVGENPLSTSIWTRANAGVPWKAAKLALT